MDDHDPPSSPYVHLPIIAIQSILSFLPPADAIRASAASRLWRLAWISSPTLTFDETPCPLKGSDFFDYVDGLIALWLQRCDARVNLDRLSLSAAVDGHEIEGRLLDVVSFAVGRNVKAIELANQSTHFWMVPSSTTLWSLLFQCKSLDDLSLRSFQFIGLDPIPCKSISVKKLSLSVNALDDATLRNLISCLPSLEHLELGFCLGLHHIRIQSLTLKKLVVFLCEEDPEEILIDAPSLQSFSYTRIRPPGLIGFSNCKSLTSLTFDRAVFDPAHDPESANYEVEDYISQIPLLEDLTFKSCKFASRIEISHSHLKRVNLKNCYGFKTAVINTPNLRCFKYSGSVFHLESFKHLYGFLEADLKLRSGSCKETEWFWFIKLRNFLENFNKSYSLELHCYVEGFPEELRYDDFLPDPFDTPALSLTFTNRKLDLEDCIHFIGAMVELLPSVETLCVRTPFAIITIKYDDSGSFTMNWTPGVRASDTEKYGEGYKLIRDAMDELVEYLGWSDEDDMDEDTGKGTDEEDK